MSLGIYSFGHYAAVLGHPSVKWYQGVFVRLYKSIVLVSLVWTTYVFNYSIYLWQYQERKRLKTNKKRWSTSMLSRIWKNVLLPSEDEESTRKDLILLHTNIEKILMGSGLLLLFGETMATQRLIAPTTHWMPSYLLDNNSQTIVSIKQGNAVSFASKVRMALMLFKCHVADQKSRISRKNLLKVTRPFGIECWTCITRWATGKDGFLSTARYLCKRSR